MLPQEAVEGSSVNAFKEETVVMSYGPISHR